MPILICCFYYTASSLFLSHIQSDNAFSGSIPKEIFLLPNITILVLSKNCFHGNLPKAMCEAETLTNLILDGLSSSTSCKSNGMHGSFRGCIWEHKALRSIHMSGI